MADTDLTSTIDRLLENLQGTLAFVDLLDRTAVGGKGDLPMEALVARRGRVVLRVRPERNHKTAHFHVEFKQQYGASYDLATLKRFAGAMPTRYEKPILAWARSNRHALEQACEQVLSGDAPEVIVIRD